MKRKRIHTLTLHICVFAVIAAYLSVTISFGIYCPFRYITGFTCPACGATRAMFSLFRGDFSAYITYNPFALPLLAVLVAFPHLGILGKFKMPVLVFSILTAAASFVYNLIRVICHA